MSEDTNGYKNIKIRGETHRIVKLSAVEQDVTLHERIDQLIRAGLAAEQKTTTREPVHEPA